MKDYIIMFIKKKEKWIYKTASLSLLKSYYYEPVVTPGVVHQIVIKDVIYKTFMTQFTSKARRPDKINFRILCIAWE